MSTLLATLGFEPAAILPTLRSCAVNRGIVFHYGSGPETAKAVHATRKAFDSVGVPVEMVALRNGYDFAACVEDILAHARQAERDSPKDEEVIFDVTGGIKVMALAAFSVAWILGKRVVYNVETQETRPTVHIPIEGLQDHGDVGPQTERALRILLAGKTLHQGQPSVTPAEMREAFGAKAASAINFHVDKLERMRALQRVHGENRKDVHYVATPAARVLALALEARRDAGAKLAPPQARRKTRAR